MVSELEFFHLSRVTWRELCFGAFLSPPASPFGFTGHYPLAARPTPPSAGTAGSGRAQTLPRWRLHDTDRRIPRDRTGHDLDERLLYNSVCHRTKRFLRRNQSVSPRIAAVLPLTILSRPEALKATRSRRACRMAISHNPCTLLIANSERGKRDVTDIDRS